MACLDSSAFTPVTGLDLLLPENANVLTNVCRMPEYVAQYTNQAFALLSLKPSKVIYTSEKYAQFAKIQVQHGQHLSLLDWFNSLFICSGIPIGAHVLPLLDKLADLSKTFEMDQPKLIFDFATTINENQKKRFQQQITYLPLGQSNPESLFLCCIHSIDHLSPAFFNEIRLVHKNTNLFRYVLTPPINTHPLIKKLSPTERKVLQHIYIDGNKGHDHHYLNMALDTLKSHRKHILKKTGFTHTDALVAVLKWEMGLKHVF